MTKDGVVTTDYIYDSRTNELKSTTTPDQTIDYRYDAAGNRISKAESAVAGIPAKLTRYWYDQFNRLDTVTVDENAGAGAGDEIVFQAEYDFRTRRTWKYEKGSGWTHFRYDGGVSFDEWKVNTSGDWAQSVEFTRGYGMGGGIGSIIYANRTTETGTDLEYFHYNAVGHTVAQTDRDMIVIASNLYEAFGGIVSHTGSDANNRLANTKERDSSIGLDNHGFRYYDAEIGRYTTRDPIGYIDGMNVYLYARNNPINFIDPLGLETCKNCKNDPCICYSKLEQGPWERTLQGETEWEFEERRFTNDRNVSMVEYGWVPKGASAEERASYAHGKITAHGYEEAKREGRLPAKPRPIEGSDLNPFDPKVGVDLRGAHVGFVKGIVRKHRRWDIRYEEGDAGRHDYGLLFLKGVYTDEGIPIVNNPGKIEIKSLRFEYHRPSEKGPPSPLDPHRVGRLIPFDWKAGGAQVFGTEVVGTRWWNVGKPFGPIVDGERTLEAGTHYLTVKAEFLEVGRDAGPFYAGTTMSFYVAAAKKPWWGCTPAE